MTQARWMALTWLALAAAGCADRATAPTPPPPPPGSAIVSLVTPHADDGAVAVTLRGPGISNLQSASSGYIFYWRLASDSVARVIVVGNVAAGPLFTFRVAAGTELSAYRVTIEEVAARDDAVRATLGNYALTLTRAP